MILIYTDETGINYKIENSQFIDGPYIIYGGLCLNDVKYFHLERLYLNLIFEHFDIADWKTQEIHATDLWSRKGYFEKFQKEQISTFFEEVFQLITKLNINVLIGYQYKTNTDDKLLKEKEIAKSITSFFHLAESYLSKNNETGIIVSDIQNNSKTQEDSIFTTIFKEKTSWRSNPSETRNPFITTKYAYESRACFLLDNIHYVNSKESIFNQVVDIVLFVIRRVFIYQDLRITNKKEADMKKVPVDRGTFQLFLQSVLHLAGYSERQNDIIFTTIPYISDWNDITSIIDDNFYISGIRTSNI
ncbi:Hypothetical protein LBF_2145 [Leptospira biflexa serovar Patoc strain 'Patoc 1 (Ames)']|uniref:DUF3800 domain-containing protein n=1 Tax=Leptospira biflexa serovar Patoc (strain Patoc 1 / ATCC 23582 / Paris) TaxID=456481 RepID=B0ST65_LEPBP|nr:DUF3800 domain-containing protein [Leptospira biflexa]ABZ94642.1 Hypothetical protein LBF_2145 [Leptospira biflexa serovar Patoc strain 'Patoc 1 (Ames)']ABZ98305.1 Hypothetical protein LEPBI_I2207 [Leptospira biflexa serovar Patoc strain 'Patoc 1 (Paris)']